MSFRPVHPKQAPAPGTPSLQAADAGAAAMMSGVSIHAGSVSPMHVPGSPPPSSHGASMSVVPLHPGSEPPSGHGSHVSPPPSSRPGGIAPVHLAQHVHAPIAQHGSMSSVHLAPGHHGSATPIHQYGGIAPAQPAPVHHGSATPTQAQPGSLGPVYPYPGLPSPGRSGRSGRSASPSNVLRSVSAPLHPTGSITPTQHRRSSGTARVSLGGALSPPVTHHPGFSLAHAGSVIRSPVQGNFVQLPEMVPIVRRDMSPSCYEALFNDIKILQSELNSALGLVAAERAAREQGEARLLEEIAFLRNELIGWRNELAHTQRDNQELQARMVDFICHSDHQHLEQRVAALEPPPMTELEQRVQEIEARGNIEVSLETGRVEVLRDIAFVPRRTTDSPRAELLKPDAARHVLDDIAEVTSLFEERVIVEGHTKGGEGNFWQALADDRARLVGQELVIRGVHHERLTTRGLPGKRGLNKVAVVIHLVDAS